MPCTPLQRSRQFYRWTHILAWLIGIAGVCLLWRALPDRAPTLADNALLIGGFASLASYARFAWLGLTTWDHYLRMREDPKYHDATFDRVFDDLWQRHRGEITGRELREMADKAAADSGARRPMRDSEPPAPVGN